MDHLESLLFSSISIELSVVSDDVTSRTVTHLWIEFFDDPRGASESESESGPKSLFLRNRGDWRRIEHSGLGPEYRVVAHAATSARPLFLFSQWFSFFVSTLEALPRDPASRLPPHPACSLVGVPGRHLARGG